MEVNKIKFHKSVCGVDFLMNMLYLNEFGEQYFADDLYSTDYFEIIFLDKAEGTVRLNNTEIELKDRMVLFISAHEKRKWKINRDRLEGRSLIFQEDFLNEFFADKYFSLRLHYFYQLNYVPAIYINDSDTDKLCDMLAEIKSELNNSKYDSGHIIRSLLYYILMKLNRIYANEFNLTAESPQNNYAYEFRRLLEVNIRDNQRVDDYAGMIGISRISLNKAVQKQFNLSAGKLIKQRLSQEIQNELLFTDHTIAEISDMLSFSEPNHMIRFFKTINDITPTAFRTENRR